MSGLDPASVIFGLALAIIASFIFEASGLSTRAAKFSKTRAGRRIVGLQTELEQLRVYRSEPVKLVHFLAARILLITILWMLQNGIDYLFGAVTNSQNAFDWASRIGLKGDVMNNDVWTTASALDLLLIVIIAGKGFGGYRTWLRFTKLDDYEPKVLAQIAELETVTGATDWKLQRQS